MAFVALKPCCFAGQRFKVGDSIPDDLIHPGAAKNLAKMQVIAKQGGETTAPTQTDHSEPEAKPITVLIHAKEGDIELNPTPEGLQEVFNVLTGTTTEAEPIISKMTDGEALILLHVSDSRKSVKAAAESRGKELSVPEGAGED